MNDMINTYKKQLSEYGVNLYQKPQFKEAAGNIQIGDQINFEDEDKNEDSVEEKSVRSEIETKDDIPKSQRKDDSDEKEKFKIPEFTDDDLNNMIYDELAVILKEYDFKVNEFEEIKSGNQINPVSSITTKACVVYKVNEADNNSEIKYECQAFRVHHNTTPSHLMTYAISFWRLPNEGNYFRFYFMSADYDFIELNSTHINTVLDTFMKQNSNSRKPIFFLCPKSISKPI